MTPSKQKLLWLKKNKKKVSALAKMIDAAVTEPPISQDEISEIIKEVRAAHNENKS